MGRRDAGGVLGRRGLLAGAVALVAGGLAKLVGAGRAEAGHNGTTNYASESVLHVDQANTTSGITIIDSSADDTPGFAVRMGVSPFLGNNHAIVGATGGAYNAGIRGSNDSLLGRGVVGEANGSDGVGVEGSGSTHGVFGVAYGSDVTDSGVKGLAGGFSATNGVWGENVGSAANATGVLGTTASGTANATVGVWGRSGSTGTGAIGTFGQSANGSGVRGLSGNGNGVFGVSTNASGVYGFSNYSFGAAGVSNVGVGVYASSGSNWGLHATSPIFAGVFSGSVYVNGNFTVANGAKSAAVKNKRGEHRRVYCQESPEAWFEDFGTAALANGRAEVQLDPEFDDVVKGDDYHVYLTPEGDCRGLYVSRKGPHRFEVRELQGGTSSLPFSYRVVARRLDDVGRRLEKVDVPDFAKVKPPVPPSDLPPAPPRTIRPGR